MSGSKTISFRSEPSQQVTIASHEGQVQTWAEIREQPHYHPGCDMKVGRNDSCPCGSGKKYKNCCLNAEFIRANPPIDMTWRRLRELLDYHPAQMLRFITETYGPLAIHEAWAEFIGDNEVQFDPETPLLQLFMPWFFHCWSPNPIDTQIENKALHEMIPTATYLAKKGHRIDPLLRRYIESLLVAPFSFYEVLECEPGTRMILRDVMTKEQLIVTEKHLSQAMQRDDLFFGQLASTGELTMVEAFNGFAIPPIEKASIIQFRADIASATAAITKEVIREWDIELLYLFHEIADRLYNPPMPTLQNTDGEAISLHKLVFDLNIEPQAAFDALKHLALDDSVEDMLTDAVRDRDGRLIHARFAWKKSGNKMHAEWDNTVLGWIEIDGKRLVAEVNSKNRADLIRGLIEKAMGDGIRYRASEIQSLDKMMADRQPVGGEHDRKALRESERLAEIPEVRVKISEMMEAHWERWVDQRLPILGDRTPMEAVRDADGREIVESLIKQGERSARNPGMHIDQHVFRRLRERLGLA